nr:IclR family transcriptional regulator [Variovorax boronicumulans]
MAAGGASAVDRVIDIFEAFHRTRGPLSLTELAAAAHIPKSSCHALVHTLVARGYLYTLEHPRALYPTQRLLGLAHGLAAGDPFLEHVLPALEDLRDRSMETVILGKRQGERVVYLHVLEGLHAIRYSARAGDLKPLHASAIGKALLGAQKEAALRAWADGQMLARITPSTITQPGRLVADLLQSRRAGYFETHGENVEDVWAVAAFLQVGRDTLAIGLAGPRHRMQDSIRAHAQQLVATCSLAALRLRRHAAA